MNILHIGICVYGRPEGLEKAFMNVAKNYYGIRPENVTEGLKNLQWRPDIIFVQIQDSNYPDAVRSVLRHWKNKGTKVISWSGDIRHETPQWMWDLAEVSTVTCFSNDRDVNNLREKGYKSEFLQIGIDPEIFTPEGEADPNAGKIVFLGNHAPHFPYGRLRLQMVKELKQTYGDDFKVYGNGWPYNDGECNVKNPLDDVATWQKKEAAIYRGCQIAISMSSFNESRYTSDRLFRAMGCGAFTIIHEFPGMCDVIDCETEPFDMFSSIHRLKLLISEYYANWDMSGNHAAEYIHNNYTYDHMVQNILRL